MGISVESAREKAKVPPEIAVRTIIQVYSDRVWCAIYASTGGGDGVQVFAVSFDRPEDKSKTECIERANNRLQSHMPTDWGEVRSPREDW